MNVGLLEMSPMAGPTAPTSKREKPFRSLKFAEPRDIEACHVLLAKGSKSFAAAGKLLPERVRDASAVLYAFCRVADDAVDDSMEADRVVRLRKRLLRAYSAESLDDPIDRAFSQLVHTFDLPIEIFLALIEGFEWDASGKEYLTLTDTLSYAARVASTVGVAMTLIVGHRERHMVSRACDLGLAMQLTNIARDVGQDARNGRLYLPSEWLVAEGVDPQDFIKNPVPVNGVRRVTLRLLEVADGLYALSDSGLNALPWDVRPALFAARFIYADIGRVVRNAGGDSVSSRAIVSKSRKLALIGKAILTSTDGPDALLFEPPTVTTEFLVNAVCANHEARE